MTVSIVVNNPESIVNLVVNNPAQTISLLINNPVQAASIDMLQEQPTQTQSLIITTGSVVVARQPVSAVEMPLLGESGLNIDFLINEYAWKG